ncbi:MAG: transglycosylase domain-containing protein [Anaerolineae bacterium]
MGLDVYRARLDALADQRFFQTTRIEDRNGVLLAEIAPHGHRTWVTLNDVAPTLRDAVIATEDRTFFTNEGVDIGRVAKAAAQNALAGDTVSGASTITMQLVRIVAFDPSERYEQTLERKLREAHLAAEIDSQYTKDEVLEAYLNVAFFGSRAYGVEAAANTYFGTSAAELDTGQATLIAGLLQAPSALDPHVNFEGARERQRVVLYSMVAAEMMTQEDADRVWAQPLELSDPPPPVARRAHHFVDYVLAALPRVLGPQLAAQGGFTVTTTLDIDLNDELGEIARRHVETLRSEHNLGDASVVALRPGSGEIVGMVGGIDYNDPNGGQVNVAVSPRQVGSAFKPITYAAALDRGYSPASLLWDVPFEFDAGDGTVYSPVNYDGRYNGPVRLRQALGNSLNAASVGLLAALGVEPVHELAREMGLSLDPDPWQYGLSLTLGGAESTLLELTGAFAALAARGEHVEPTSILRVSRLSDGQAIYEHQPRPDPVVGRYTAWLMWDMLSDPAARQPAFPAASPLETSRPTAVKTGTTNDFRDNLTVGFTPYIAIGVWTGNKDGSPMRDVLGITGAAPIWHDAMEYVLADEALRVVLGDGLLPDDEPQAPAGIVRADVCDLSTLDGRGSCTMRTEVYAPGRPLGDRGQVFEWLTIGGAGTGASGSAGARCAVTSAPGEGRLYLLPPERADLADQVRRYAVGRGLAVAPPICGGAATSASTTQ